MSVQRPELACVPAIKDFGNVSQGESLPATFELQNNFNEPIEIVTVKRSCGCSEIQLSRKGLASRETTTLSTIWHTRGSRGPQNLSLWVIYRLKDSQQEGYTEVGLKGNVEPDIICETTELKFQEDTKATKTVKLRPGKMSAFRVIQVSCTQRAWTAMWNEKESTVEVRFDPKLASDDVIGRHFLHITTDSKNEPLVRIPLWRGYESESR
jgi:hypothetical protein